MHEKVHLQFYRVSHCGYFAAASGHQFGSLSGLLTDLKAWAKGKSLGETAIVGDPGDGASFGTYLVGVDEQAGDFLVSLWNEVPATADNQMASIPANAKVGSAKSVLNSITPGSIPGYATYFWFAPSRSIFASLRIDQIRTGQPALQRYMERFLAYVGPHVVQLPANGAGGPTVTGYAESAADPPRTDVNAQFRTKAFTKPGQLELIEKRASDITKLHRKASLKLKVPDDRSAWQRFLSVFHAPSHQLGKGAVRVSGAISVSLTSAEVKTLIKEWSAQHSTADWDDCGFTLRGEPSIHWLSRSLAKAQESLNLQRINAAQVDGKSLLASIVAARERLLLVTV